MGIKRVWNKSACLNYLRAFDAFKHKYLNNDDSSIDGKIRDHWDDILNSQSHGISNHNFSMAEESEAALGIEQVYQDTEHYTNEYIEMLNLVRDKFIFDYTGIAGLCDFFLPAYFEFEWGMHLEIDYERHTSRFYRDHYIHQIRNLYEMFTLLDDFGYYQKCEDAYLDPENNIGTYITEMIQQEILSLNPKDLELYGKILFLNRKEDLRGNELLSFLMNIPNDKKEPAVQSQIKEVWESIAFMQIARKNAEKLKKLMLRHVVYSATIIASLVHDIGYPISYIRRVSDRLNKNLPMNTLLAASNKDYTEIERSLQNSLLFHIVDHDKIKHRLDNSEEHGAQSAVILLMYFHQHEGSLSVLQKCAIEVAALITYNHTNSYSVINKIKDSAELIRSDIHKAPLSHIFRMCDDLQEWDRVYFEVTSENNMVFCPNCHTPITRQCVISPKSSRENQHHCFCSKTCNGIYDPNMFVSRRILNVIGCDSMQVEQIKSGYPAYGTKFIMNYDCAKLLNIMTFSSSYARVRADAIMKLKRLHSYQGMFDSVLIDSFVSGNPFTVKIKILEQCLVLIMTKDKSSEKTIGAYIKHNNRKHIIEKLLKITGWNDSELYNPTWMVSFNFYMSLLTLGESFQGLCGKIIKHFPMILRSDMRAWGKTFKEYFNEAWRGILADFESLGHNTTNKSILDNYQTIYNRLLEVIKSIATSALLHSNLHIDQNDTMFDFAIDYLIYQAHLFGYQEIEMIMKGESKITDTRLQSIVRQFYEHLNCSNDYLCNQVDMYISRSRCINNKQEMKMNPSCVDYYVDYAVFLQLWEKIKQTRQSFFKRHDESIGSNYILPLNDLKNATSSEHFLVCKTPSGSFDSRYDFSFHWKSSKKSETQETEYQSVDIGLDIDWNNRTAYLDIIDLEQIDLNALQVLLRPIYEHHSLKQPECP